MIPLSLGNRGGRRRGRSHPPAQRRPPRASHTNREDKQTGFEIHVVRGERSFGRIAAFAKFTLKGIPPMAAGMARLRGHVPRRRRRAPLRERLWEERTGLEQTVTVKPLYGLDDETVNRCSSPRSITGREASARKLAEVRVEAHRVVSSTKKSLRSGCGPPRRRRERERRIRRPLTLLATVRRHRRAAHRSRISDLGTPRPRISPISPHEPRAISALRSRQSLQSIEKTVEHAAEYRGGHTRYEAGALMPPPSKFAVSNSGGRGPIGTTVQAAQRSAPRWNFTAAAICARSTMPRLREVGSRELLSEQEEEEYYHPRTGAFDRPRRLAPRDIASASIRSGVSRGSRAREDWAFGARAPEHLGRHF